jgi:hypothetical protein
VWTRILPGKRSAELVGRGLGAPQTEASYAEGPSDAFPNELADRVGYGLTAIAVSSKAEIQVTSSMPAWPSNRRTRPANCSVSHSTTSTPASPSATPTRSDVVLASRMNIIIAAIAPGPASSSVPSGTKAMLTWPSPDSPSTSWLSSRSRWRCYRRP